MFSNSKFHFKLNEGSLRWNWGHFFFCYYNSRTTFLRGSEGGDKSHLPPTWFAVTGVPLFSLVCHVWEDYWLQTSGFYDQGWSFTQLYCVIPVYWESNSLCGLICFDTSRRSERILLVIVQFNIPNLQCLVLLQYQLSWWSTDCIRHF